MMPPDDLRDLAAELPDASGPDAEDGRNWRHALVELAAEIGIAAGTAHMAAIPAGGILGDAVAQLGPLVPHPDATLAFMRDVADAYRAPLFNAGEELRTRALRSLRAGAPKWKVEEIADQYRGLIPDFLILFHLRWAASKCPPRRPVAGFRSRRRR